MPIPYIFYTKIYFVGSLFFLLVENAVTMFGMFSSNKENIDISRKLISSSKCSGTDFLSHLKELNKYHLERRYSINGREITENTPNKSFKKKNQLKSTFKYNKT